MTNYKLCFTISGSETLPTARILFSNDSNGTGFPAGSTSDQSPVTPMTQNLEGTNEGLDYDIDCLYSLVVIWQHVSVQ